MKKVLFITVIVVSALLMLAATIPQRIVLIGDSTVCNYNASYSPQTGWGQVLALFFQTGSVTVINKAIGGRSSRSYIEEGRWTETKGILQNGDILLIQFGHNDRDFTKAERYTDTANYKKYLALYITESRALGVTPILVTPMNMNTWTNATTVREVFCEGANNYRAAMIHVGDSLKVAVIDLEKKSKLLMDTLGQPYLTSFHFLGLAVGEYPKFPNGISDGTHFQEMGALENARMISEGLTTLKSILAPLYPVTIVTNNSSGGLHTRSLRKYPAGATITLKVIPTSGHTFQSWQNAVDQVVATTTRHTFVQGTAASTWKIIFAGTSSPSSSSLSSSSSSVIQNSSSVAQSSSSSVTPPIAPPETEAPAFAHPNRYPTPALAKKESTRFYNLLGRSTVFPSH